MKAYYEFTSLLFLGRHSVPINFFNSIDTMLESDYDLLFAKFQQFAMKHSCTTVGCGNCLVVDGHMKAHRKLCKNNSCENEPKHLEKYCDEHLLNVDLPQIVDDHQTISQPDQFYISKIIEEINFNGKKLYKVQWENYSETTNEPKENIPRVLVELFDLYGDSSVPTDIDCIFEYGNFEYVKILINNTDTLILPKVSLEVNVEAYHIPDYVSNDDCQTLKKKKRFYSRTGGILVMAKPCGTFVDIKEIFGGESCHQIAEELEKILDYPENKIDTIIYDDTCHLHKFVQKRKNTYKKLNKCKFYIDRFHLSNHKREECRTLYNIDNCKELTPVNTEIMEQMFGWLSKFKNMLKYMSKPHFKFFILDLLDRHNFEMSNIEIE